jgi:hypothetical protein
MPRREAWERTVLLPGRIVSLPLSLLGRATDRALLFGEQTNRIPTGVNPTGIKGSSTGLLIRPPALGGRAGFGAAVEVREPVLDGRMKTTLRARYAATVRNYNATLIEAAGQPLTVRYGYDWRPEEHFYGTGPGSSRLGVSDYATQSEYVRAVVEHAWRPSGAPSPGMPDGTRVALWTESRDQITVAGRESGVPSYDLAFPDIAAGTLGRRVDHLIYGASLSVDGRAGIPHWTHGGRVMLSAERHDAPVEALALRVGSPKGAQFNRYEMQAETGFSFLRDPRTVRLMARVVDQSIGSGGEHLLPSEMATLGGGDGLGGYGSGRFHDRDLLLTRASYVFPIARRLELDVHSEWGAVYPDVWKDARLDRLNNSYGVSLRGRYEVGLLAALGFDFSREGMRLTYALGGLK